MVKCSTHDVLRTEGGDVGLAGGAGQFPSLLSLQDGVLVPDPVPGPGGDRVGAGLYTPVPWIWP